MDQLSAYYTAQSAQLKSDILRLRQRSRYFMTGEILTFLASIGWVVAFTTHWGEAWMLWCAALFLALYVFVRRRDEANSTRMERLSAQCRVYDHELQFLHGDFSCFDDGTRYNNPQEPFAIDLDVFGPQSLFNRIDRTLTTGGSNYLAACLSRLSLTREQGLQRRQTVDALAVEKEWRARYLACAADRKIDTQRVAESFAALKQLNLSSFTASKWMPYVAWASLGVLAGLTAVSALTSLPASVPVLWATGQLLYVCLFCRGTLTKVTRQIDASSRQMTAYAEIVTVMASLREKSDKPEELQMLVDSVAEAEVSFAEFSRLLADFDRCNSFMRQIIYSLTFMTVFLIHRFLRWQQTFAGRMEQWMEAISRLDALVSMATFRFNEPASGTAEIVESDKMIYEACGLYHPFLGAKAVRNDFSISDSHYYIITGANMAGKSTFLRSVGINYVLARNGMPVFADRLKVSVYSLFSSMRTTDDLAHGISYFNAELLRLKQLIAYCQSQPHTLIILDEILKGTNSLDKLNGSRLFLEHISRLPVSGIIATHDLELSKMEERNGGRFHNYCFEIELSDRVSYSYKLTQGVARNQNATFLLKQILNT